MIKKSKLALVALLAATVIASPALAQSRWEAGPADSPALTGGGSFGYNQAQDSPDHN
jgi:hypothetical protein